MRNGYRRGEEGKRERRREREKEWKRGDDKEANNKIGAQRRLGGRGKPSQQQVFFGQDGTAAADRCARSVPHSSTRLGLTSNCLATPHDHSPFALFALFVAHCLSLLTLCCSRTLPVDGAAGVL